jgi:hypothetical protein
MGDKFYMVIRDIGSSTTVRHSTLGDAMVEAERLCGKEDARFYVLETIAACEPQHKPVKWCTIGPTEQVIPKNGSLLNCCGNDECQINESVAEHGLTGE